MTDGTTHWHNCYAFGRKHYDCLLAHCVTITRERDAFREALKRIESVLGVESDWYRGVAREALRQFALTEMANENQEMGLYGESKTPPDGIPPSD